MPQMSVNLICMKPNHLRGEFFVRHNVTLITNSLAKKESSHRDSGNIDHKELHLPPLLQCPPQPPHHRSPPSHTMFHLLLQTPLKWKYHHKKKTDHQLNLENLQFSCHSPMNGQKGKLGTGSKSTSYVLRMHVLFQCREEQKKWTTAHHQPHGYKTPR